MIDTVWYLQAMYCICVELEPYVSTCTLSEDTVYMPSACHIGSVEVNIM